MKKLILVFLIFAFPLLSSGQASLGYTMQEIKKQFPTKSFSILTNDSNENNNGGKYLSAEYTSGMMYYFFDNRVETTNLCLLIPRNYVELDKLIAHYNKNYSIQSDNVTWKCHMENGETMKIVLVYSPESDQFSFGYANWK